MNSKCTTHPVLYVVEVDRFPSVERERAESSEGGPVRSRTPKQDLNHIREVIFALPSLQLHLKTEHWQAALTPEPSGGTTQMVVDFGVAAALTPPYNLYLIIFSGQVQ